MTGIRALLIAATGLLPAAAAAAAEDAVKKDKEKLTGTWQVVAVEANGQKFPAEATRDFRFIFTADSATRQRGGTSESGAGYRLDPSRSPKWIDMTGEKDGKAHAVPGLYALDGDTLKLCFQTDYKKDGQPADALKRPTKLDGGPGSEQVLMTLKRAKP
jgi:uncharacterized protein (TIGR03067 family)